MAVASYASSQIDAAVVIAAIRRLPRTGVQHPSQSSRHRGRICDLTARTGLARNRVVEALRTLHKAEKVEVEWPSAPDDPSAAWAVFTIEPE